MTINLTPHQITVIDPSCVEFDTKKKCYNLVGELKIARVIEPSGQVARVAMTEEVIGEEDGITVVQNRYGEPQDLPTPQTGIIYIVSALVATAAKRNDLRVPARMVRNEAGQPVGCLALAKI